MAERGRSLGYAVATAGIDLSHRRTRIGQPALRGRA